MLYFFCYMSEPQLKMNINELVEGATMSHLAVENRDIDYLTNVDKDELSKQDRDGETSLHYAAVNDDLEICKLLVSRNPSIVNIKDVEKKTPYDWVVEYNLEYDSHINIIYFLKSK